MFRASRRFVPTYWHIIARDLLLNFMAPKPLLLNFMAPAVSDNWVRITASSMELFFFFVNDSEDKTCPKCTVASFPNRTQQLRGRPKRYRNGRCSNIRTAPEPDSKSKTEEQDSVRTCMAQLQFRKGNPTRTLVISGKLVNQTRNTNRPHELALTL